MKFDAKKVRLMAPDTSAAIDGFPGLRMAATATKRTWTYRYRSPTDNSLKQIKLGEWPALTYSQAIAAWEAARTARSSGVDAATEKRQNRQRATSGDAAEPSAYTVKKLSVDYLASIEKTRSASSLLSVTNLFRRQLEPISNQEPQSVTRTVAYELLQGVADRPALAIKLKSELAQAWDYGIDSGKLPTETVNQWRLIMRGKLRSQGRMRAGKRTKVKRVLSASEVGEVIGWLPRCSDLLRDVLTLYLWTGARGGELVQMEGREVRKESDGVLWWTCPKRKTKNCNRDNATDFRVPLIGRAADIVRARAKSHGKGWLFPSDASGHTKQGTISQALYKHQPYSQNNKSCYDSGLTVTHWSPHDLRRTARTMLAQLGCPHEIGEAILGHVLGGVAGVYNLHSYDDERRDWLTRLDVHLESCASNQPGIVK